MVHQEGGATGAFTQHALAQFKGQRQVHWALITWSQAASEVQLSLSMVTGCRAASRRAQTQQMFRHGARSFCRFQDQDACRRLCKSLQYLEHLQRLPKNFMHITEASLPCRHLWGTTSTALGTETWRVPRCTRPCGRSMESRTGKAMS